MERSADWMSQAERDLQHARDSVALGHFDWACFSAQQSAEKAVKAVLNRLGAEARGHSVRELLDALGERAAIPPDLAAHAQELDQVYISARYPDALPSGAPRDAYSQSQSERLINYADEIVRFCNSHLA